MTSPGRRRGEIRILILLTDLLTTVLRKAGSIWTQRSAHTTCEQPEWTILAVSGQP